MKTFLISAFFNLSFLVLISLSCVAQPVRDGVKLISDIISTTLQDLINPSLQNLLAPSDEAYE